MQYKIVSLATAGLGVIIGVVWWLSPHSSSDTHSLKTLPRAEQTITQQRLPESQLASWSSRSQQDTQVNCQLSFSHTQQLIVNEQVRQCFEYFISQYGEKSVIQLSQDFVHYVQLEQPKPAQAQLIDLWQRYLNYRQALGDTQKPAQAQEDPQYFRAIFDNLKSIRQQHFSAAEILGLFQAEDLYHDYTLSRMQVLKDPDLSEAEKAQQLAQLFENLPTDWQENLKQLSQLDDLRHLTQQIKQRGGSAEEIRQMRTQLVGAEATTRLEHLDQQREQWQSRVTQYLNERDNTLKSGLSDTAKNSAIQQLREQYFQTAQEQTRLYTFEQVHDQGGKLPFAE